MLGIKETYDRFNQIGCCSFATLDGKGGASSRIAHFFAYDDEGLYLRTMAVKPFYRQLKEGGKLAVSGEFTKARIEYDKDNLPHFEPGFQMRIEGDVRELSSSEVQAKAACDRNFNVAVFDMNKYPETRVFVLHRAHGELYDYDYGMTTRTHKIYRERFAFGGDTFEQPGLSISDACIGCGACADTCTFEAIIPGNPYSIINERCDECGNCLHVCPVDAVLGKGGQGRDANDPSNYFKIS